MAALSCKMQVSRLKEVHDLFKPLTDAINITLRDNGWEIRSADKANVAMAAVTVNLGAFEYYDAETGVIKLSLERLKNILARASSKDIIEMELGADGQTVRCNCGNLSWRMSLLAPDEHIPRVPSWNQDEYTEVEVQTQDLVIASKIAKHVADQIELATAKGQLKLLAENSGEEAEMILAVPTVESQRVILPLDYFADCVGSIPSEYVLLHLRTDYPVYMDIDAWDGTLKGQYLIAPRIEEEG